MSYASSSPISPSSPGGFHKSIPAGFLPFSRPQQKRLDQLTHRELLERYAQNKNILNQPIPSTSSHHQRVITEQAAIEEILGMEALQQGIARTHITEVDHPMDSTDTSPPPPQSRAVETKRRLIERYYGGNTKQRGATKSLGLDEAMALEQKAHLAALERKKQEEERRRQYGLPRPGEFLTREEREARIWAYMNTKPSESDEEDEDWNENDENETDPSRWFEYDEDDGKQGQPLVDPDEIADIIRVDDSHWE
ncbi:hypothetical protein BU17DRAFT_79924 [Hysterangium stoloniferum]|nr:hypothetical protein BU17DRAFT_79924 [Hysterangium stoloniferum]